MLRFTFAVPALLAAAPALAQTEGYRPGYMTNWGHGGYGDYGVGMMFGPVLWLIVLGLVVAGVIWFVRRAEGGSAAGAGSALAMLDIRLAKGEIDAKEYGERKKLLLG